MPWYRCFIVGENFPGAIIDELSPIGFHATRFVEADRPEEAETKVLANLSDELNVALPPGMDRPENAEVVVAGIEEVDRSQVDETNRGFSFFVMG